MTGDVAQWFESRISNPKTLGSIPWRGKVSNSLSLSLRVNSRADSFLPDPPLVCTTRTGMCTHIKDPTSICRKRVGLTAGDTETRKHCTQGGGVLWIPLVLNAQSIAKNHLRAVLL